MVIKTLLKKLVYGHRADSESYVKYLRKKGMHIGEGTSFISPKSTCIDEQRPWMISIGKGCCITAGVTILQHDYSWSVLKAVYGEVIGFVKKVSIGDHVFIGMNTTITAGVKIGNNVIIGANSLVSKDIPDNVVAAGNPCRVISTVSEYHEKRKKAELNEAVEMVREYKNTYGKNPPKEVLREHFWLFEDNYDDLIPEYKSVMKLVYGTEEFSKEVFEKHKKSFKDYNDFLNYCFRSN